MAANPSVTVVGRTIEVVAPFQFRDRLKAIASRAWDPVRRAWTYPATPAAAYEIHQALGITPGMNEAGRLSVCHAHGLDVLRTGLGVPDSSKVPLFRHQRIGVSLILAREAAYLAHDMGTGKTRTTIEAMRRALTDPKARALVVCPKSVARSWARQLELWAPGWGKALVLDDGSVPERAEKLKAALAMPMRYLVVVNYEAAWRPPLADILLSHEWGMIVADEIHRIKEPGRGDYAAIMRRKNGANDSASARSNGVTSLFMAELGWRGRIKVGLSGTPAPNSPLDLWAQMRFLDPGLFERNFGAHKVLHTVRGGYAGKQVVAYSRVDELNRKFYSLAHVVRKEEVIDLPEVTHVERPVTLCERAERIYREIERSFVATLPDDLGEVTIRNALVELLRLQQITGGFVKTDDGTEHEIDDSKREAVREILEDLPADEPLVVFCRFRHDLAAVHSAAAEAGRKSGELSGSRNDLEAWQAGGPDAPTVLAVQVQSGGLGIDLSRARYAVFFSLGFSLGEYEQALARLHRIGQKRKVEYIHLVAEGTVDERVYSALRRKASVVEAVLADYCREKSAIPKVVGVSGRKEV